MMHRFLKLNVLALVAVTTPACLDSGSEAFDSSEQRITGQSTGQAQVYTITEAKPAEQAAPAQRQQRYAGRVIEGPRKAPPAVDDAARPDLAGQDAQASLDRNALTARGRVIEGGEKKILPSGYADETGADGGSPLDPSTEEDEFHTLAGGPDGYGYTYISSNDPDGQRFFWIDISATGTQLPLTDDSRFHPVDLPFSFYFYGGYYNQVAVASNGAIYFDPGYLGHINAPIPGPSSWNVDRFIAAYWDDLDPGAGGAVYAEVRGTAPLRRFIVQWDDVPHYHSNDTVTVQAILFEDTGNILLQYFDPSLEAGREATVGIQGSTTVGLQYLHDTPALTAGTSLCFVPPGGGGYGCRLNGPDGGGYSVTDSIQPGGTPFFWQDISTTGTFVPLTDESYSSAIPLPFTFSYYHTSHDSIRINANGTLLFDDLYLGYQNARIPGVNPEFIDRFIAVYWDDLDPGAGGGVYYQVRGSAPNRRMIIQWNDVPHYASADRVTFQAILFEGAGNILMQYLNPSLEIGSGATVGLQNAVSQGLQYEFNEPALSVGLAVCFSRHTSSSAGCRVNGPDAGGYTVTDSNQAGSPQFYWREISNTGTRMLLSDDSYYYPISLPFTFHFYGVGHTNVAVASNGTIYFENAYLGYNNPPIPYATTEGINHFIAAYWDDLNPAAGGAMYYQIEGTAPNRRLVVEWKDVPHYASFDTVSLQAILFEGTNNILVQYLDSSGEAGAGGTVGIQNNASVGLLYAFNEAVLTDRLAVCFSPPGGNSTGCRMANWLSNKGTGSAQEGLEYYAAIGAPSTFAQWKSLHGFGTGGEVSARYYNDFDLGLGRHMNCRQNGTDVACYVTNYGIAPGGPAQPAINNAINEDNPLATVAMVYKYMTHEVHFYVYDGNGFLIPQVALDSEGPKGVPQLCLPCHGGTYDAAANRVTGASFLPFDVFSYVFSNAQPQYSFDSQAEAFRQLNAMVWDTYPALAISEVIAGLYPNGVKRPGSPVVNTYVPPGWADKPDVYNHVVKPACRGCHVAQPFNLTTSAQMGFAQSSLCLTHQMPHAEKPFKKFWTSTAPHMPTFLANAMGWPGCNP